jgi:hypothetical protein
MGRRGRSAHGERAPTHYRSVRARSPVRSSRMFPPRFARETDRLRSEGHQPTQGLVCLRLSVIASKRRARRQVSEGAFTSELSRNDAGRSAVSKAGNLCGHLFWHPAPVAAGDHGILPPHAASKAFDKSSAAGVCPPESGPSYARSLIVDANNRTKSSSSRKLGAGRRSENCSADLYPAKPTRTIEVVGP